jgi:hypothetical protein
VNLEAEDQDDDKGSGSEGEEQDKATTTTSVKAKTRASREKRSIDEFVANIKSRMEKDESDIAHRLNSGSTLSGDEKIKFLAQCYAYIRKHCRLTNSETAKKARETLLPSWKMSNSTFTHDNWLYIQNHKYDFKSDMQLTHIKADK